MVFAYMMKYYRWHFDDALKHIQAVRAVAGPNTGFTAQLKAMDMELRASNGYETVEKRKRPAEGAARGPGMARLEKKRGVGPAMPPPNGSVKGPAGPPRGPVGPAGPPRGPVGPAGPPGA